MPWIDPANGNGLFGGLGQDCDAVARKAYDDCVRAYAGAKGRAQYCTEQSRQAGEACRAAAAAAAPPPTPAPAPPPPTEMVAAPGLPAGVPIEITTRTAPIEIYFELPPPPAPALINEVAPPPPRPMLVAPPPPALVPVPVPVGLPPNARAVQYQRPVPEPVPVRRDVRDVEAERMAARIPGWLIAAGVAALAFLGGE